MIIKRIIVFLLLALAAAPAWAQKDTVLFILADTAGGSGDYYLAGNINGWNPQDSNYKFKRDADGTLFLITAFDKATQLEFKFTRGSWNKVECNSNGTDIANRKLKTDTAEFTLYYVSGWVDNFKKAAGAKQHTSSINVRVLDTAFFIQQLNRHRRIWLYLPNDYSTSTKQYPVLYMHDGQNLFDKATTAYGEEWGVDETLDSLASKGKQACIVVGIDNGEANRMSEYNPYAFTWKNEASTTNFLAEGNQYLAFITETLKPYIDAHYRTMPGKEGTAIAGSSMGGLISYYAALKYPQVFGKAGIFSPAFWTAPGIKAYTDSAASNVSAKFFFYLGEKEGAEYLADMNEIMEKLGTLSKAMVYAVIDKEGQHNEMYWRKWFADFYLWVSADGYNYIVPVEE